LQYEMGCAAAVLFGFGCLGLPAISVGRWRHGGPAHPVASNVDSIAGAHRRCLLAAVEGRESIGNDAGLSPWSKWFGPEVISWVASAAWARHMASAAHPVSSKRRA